MVEYRILGALRVIRDDLVVELGGPRQQLVLAVLLLHANQSVPTSHLVDGVWGAAPPNSARKTAQAYVSRLRRAIGDEVVETTSSGYLLRVDTASVDAGRFQALVADARAHLPAEPEPAGRLLESALSEWRGAAWGALADTAVLAPDAARLTELRRSAVEDRLEVELALGRGLEVVSELEGLVAAHPLRERPRGLLMVALYRAGRSADALGLYDQTRRLLRTELGSEPDPRLQQVHERILRQDPDLLRRPRSVGTTRGGAAGARNPYKGLRSFGADDTEDFHGREAFVADALARLADEPMVALVGPSGSGKSSVVRAGVLPRVPEEPMADGRRWRAALMVPGERPFAAVAAALDGLLPDATHSRVDAVMRGDDLDLVRAGLHVCPHEDDHVLLVVDQFEEVFVSAGDPTTADRFVRNLAELAEDPHGRITPLVTIRADFVDRPLSHPRLGRWIDRGLVTLLPMSPAELEEACVAPATSVGVAVAPELSAELVAEVAGNPGALPQFQYALTELFDSRGPTGLTLEAYRAIGGVSAVLAQRAEQEYQVLDDAGAVAAREVFLRLVTPGDGVDDTRRRARRGELEGVADDPAVTQDVLARFGRVRLLTFDRDATGEATVEVAHEAMLRAWPRLRDWVDAVRDDLRDHRRLTQAAAEWVTADRHDDYLLSGAPLDRFGGLADTVQLTDEETDYLRASLDRRDRDRRLDDRRREQERELERRANGRLRLVAAVLAVATVVGAALTALAVNRSDVAAAERDAAVVARELNLVGELTAGAVAVRESDPELSLLLALQAVDLTQTIDAPVPGDTVAALHWGLQESGVAYPVVDAPTQVLESPDGPRGIFELPIDELVALAATSVSRPMTPDECQEWLDLSACPDPRDVPPTDLTAGAAPAVPGERAASPLARTTVTYLNSGFDAAGLEIETDLFHEATGITVAIDFEFATHLINAQLADGDVDLALLPAPSDVLARGRAGELVDVAGYLDPARLRDDLSASLVDRATDGSAIWGVPVDLSVKSMIWYPVPAFADAGYEVPDSWPDLVALVDQIVADGRTPWCHAETQGLDVGWPGTDWIEDLVLHDLGPDAYDQWVTHEIGFDDPRIRRAFERYGQLVLGPRRIHGGSAAAVTAQTDTAWRPMIEDPPQCWLMHMPSFGTQWMGGFGIQPGVDVDQFSMPPVSPHGRDTMLGGGAYLIVLRDRPEVRETVRWLIGPEFGRDVAARPWDPVWTFRADRNFPLDAYANPSQRQAAEAVQAAIGKDTFRFDGSDLMPLPVMMAFWEAMVMYLQDGPDNLDEVLAHVEAAWQDVEDG